LARFAFLEVKPEHDLDHSATWIVGGRDVLVSRAGNTKTGIRVIESRRDCCEIVRRATNSEVDVVESVQEFSAKFKVRVFSELDLLNDTDIRTVEVWSFER
jgi:hypothetical protein